MKKENTPVIYEDEEKLPVTAQYSRMGAGADISYESGESGVKETMVLRERPESNVFRYVLDLEGLTPRKNPTDQGITFYDDEDDIAADISPAWMNDATGSAYSEDITYDIEKESGSTYILTMTVDRDYLDDEDRQYPAVSYTHLDVYKRQGRCCTWDHRNSVTAGANRRTLRRYSGRAVRK